MKNLHNVVTFKLMDQRIFPYLSSILLSPLSCPTVHCPAPTLEEEGVVRELGVGGLERGQDAGDGDGGRALDVVVEGAVAVAVLLQEAERVVVAEVLELYQAVLKRGRA